MATLVLTSVTGSGKSGFGTTITVQNAYAEMDTPGFFVHSTGLGTIKRVHQVAWYGVGFDGGGYPNDLVTWGKWMDFEREYINVSPGFLAYGDTFFWETTQGTTVSFEVDY